MVLKTLKCKKLILNELQVIVKCVHSHYWSGGSDRMVWEPRFLCHSFLVDRKIVQFTHGNIQSLGNLIDHAAGDIVFSPFNPPDLFAGIPNTKSQFFLGHFLGQSQLTHPVSKGIQEIFVYHILHIQEWWFMKDRKSPYMGYFDVFDYFWTDTEKPKKER